MEEKRITVAEAAKELNVGIETMRRYIRSGLFTGAKIGRAYLIREADVKRFLADKFAEADAKRKPADVGRSGGEE
ncbi:MAG: Helix-turn-helix domain [Bryobacterales bacterium]|nr:Helix-turn-helix domain [Bryobacterales bacterium]